MIEGVSKAANEIEFELQNTLSNEIPSSKIGVLVMDKLKNLDEVAYIRFASVYREFKDLETFLEELENIKSQRDGK